MAPPTDIVRVGQILREARERTGLRQEDVAKALGIRQTLVSKYELGQVADPGLRILVRWGDYLDIETEELAEAFRSTPKSRRLARVAS